MRNELPERYIILGSEDPDQSEQPLAWHTELGWVMPELATLYDNRILIQGIPLPPKTHTIMDWEDGTQFPISPTGERGAPIV